jgi:hypothetical protein
MHLSTGFRVLLLFGIIFCVIPEAAHAEFDSERVQGSLESSDARTSDGSPYQRLEFRGEAGQQITIELTSSDFDAYLILQDSNGRNIAVDDDGGSNGNDARLRVTLPSSGHYQALVTTYNPNGRGNYTFTIAETSTVSSNHISSGTRAITPSQSSTCDSAIAQLSRSLSEGRQLSVTYTGAHDAAQNHPVGRPLNYSFKVSPPMSNFSDARALMSSPQLLASLTSPFLANCVSAAAVSLGLDFTEESVTLGEVDGQVAAFQCAEDIGFRMNDGRQSPWGYTYCEYGER